MCRYVVLYEKNHEILEKVFIYCYLYFTVPYENYLVDRDSIKQNIKRDLMVKVS